MKKLLAVFMFLFLFILFPSLGQKVEFEHITDYEGLISGGITCSIKDSYGFMWFGSSEGLSRYDGYSFTNFVHVPQDTNSLNDNFIRSLHETNKKELIIGYGYSGISIFNRDTESFIRYRHNKNDPTSLVSDYVMSIYGDKKGNVWIATRSGLEKFDTENKTFLHYKPFPEDHNFVSSITEDENGNLWLYGRGYQICRFNISNESTEYFTFSENINPEKETYRGGTILYDRMGNLWIGNEYHGLFQYNPKKDTCRVFTVQNKKLRTNINFKILEDAEGYIWIGSDGGGLIKYKYQDNSFENYVHDPANPSSLRSNAIYSLYESSPGIIWIGLYKAGVDIYKKNKKKFYHLSNIGDSTQRLTNPSILSFAKADSGKIWVGTDGGGLNLLDPQTLTIKNFTTSNSIICSNVIKSILQDKTGKLWLGTYGKGLCLLDLENSEAQSFMTNTHNGNKTIKSDHVWSLCESSEDEIWIGLLDFGFNVHKKSDSSFTHYPFDSAAFEKGLSSIYVIKEDSKKRIWIGSEREGLALYDQAKKTFTYFNEQNGNQSLSDNGINDVFEDSHGSIWIGTMEGGLNKLVDAEKKIFIAYTSNDGLPSNNIKSIQEDDQNNLWLSTDKGICLFNPKNKKTLDFDREDGVQGKDFHYNTSLKDDNGYIYFGGIHGINMFHPDSIRYNKNKPQIVFTDFKIFNSSIKQNSFYNGRKYANKAISIANEITLSYQDYVFSVEFAALDYIAPQKNKYAYKLEGFDKDWTYVDSDKRFATYTNLDPGKYTLRVIASNNDGLWNNEGAKLQINILPPWWMTWWFRATVSLLLLTLAISFYYFRLNSIKKRNRLLEDEVEKRTSEIACQSDQILQQKNELELKKIELEHLNKTKDKFFSIIGHDLKNPVKALTFLTEALKNDTGEKTEVQKELIHHMDLSSRSIKNLIFSLLEWARTQSGQVKLDPVNIPLKQLLEENIQLNAQLAAQKEINITLSCDENHCVYGDYQMINTIVRNLLSNSIKYTQTGGEIAISSELTGDNEIKISISDNGIGMPEELLQNLFSLDKGVSIKGTDNETGTGLGLIISQEFAQLNKGNIFAHSTLGKGSTFYLVLPSLSKSSVNSDIPTIDP